MVISFSPFRAADPALRLLASVSGDVVTVDGEAFDFGRLNEGDVLPRGSIGSFWFAGEVARANGEVRITLALPHGVDAPDETRFPLAVSLVAGPVPVPPYDGAEAVS